MFLLNSLACLVGGILAASGFIVAKSPKAKEYIGKLTPFQAAIGVGMMVLAVINILDGKIQGSIRTLDFALVFGITLLAMLFSQLVVGFLLGFSLIAKWLPGEGKGEQKALDIQKKLMKFQVPFGFISIFAGVMLIYYRIRF